MCIEGNASNVSYGPVQTKELSCTAYFSRSIDSLGSGTRTFTGTVSGYTTLFGLNRNGVYQILSVSPSAGSWTNHQHKNNFVYGSGVKVSEGGAKIVFDTNIFTFNGANYPRFDVSFPISITATAVNAGTSSYPKYWILGAVDCSWTCTFTVSYREVYNATTNQKLDTLNDTQKGIFGAIKDFFGSFFKNLIDSVIGLFVPSSDEMSALFNELNKFFSDTFGFLYAPFDYLIQLVGVLTGSSGSTGLTLPGFSIMGHEVWGDQTYDIAGDPVAGKVLEYVRIGTGVLLGGWFIMYLQDFFKERFGKG